MARVAREIVAPPRASGPLSGPGALARYTRTFGPRLLLFLILTIAVGAMLPALQVLDERLFLALNRLGDGPEWLYQALDPHSRNYVLITAFAVAATLVAHRRWRYVGGTALAVVFAAFFSDVLLEVVQLGVDRARPEEALGSAAQLSHERSWGHIPSFPSGHLVVTAAMVAASAAAVPRLRAPLLLYLAAVAITRVTFGAHFPLDIAVGAMLGWEVGLFSAGAVAAAGLLPRAELERRGLPRLAPPPQPVPGERAP